MAYLLDLTGAHTGYLPILFGKFPVGAPKAHPFSIIVFSNQLARESTAPPPGVEVHEATDATEISRRVVDWVKAQAAGDLAIVGSFRPDIWELQYQGELAGRDRLEIHSVGKFVSRYLETTGLVVDETAWNENILPEARALETLARALMANGGRLRKTQLRPKLELEDRVFQKTNPLTANPKVIGSLLNLAESKGLVSLVNNEHNDPIITLVGSQATTAPKATAAIPGTYPTGISATAQPAANRPMAPTVPAKAYAERFTEALAGIRMGPFPNLRPNFIKALIRRLEESLTVDALVSRCVSDVRAAYVDAGNSENHLPWPIVRRFFERLLARAKVLQAEDGSPLWPSFEHAATRVSKLAPDYQLELEGALVLYLLDEIEQIEFADVPSVTGSLFLTRSEGDRYQLLDILTHLRKTGKITLEDDHYRRG